MASKEVAGSAEHEMEAQLRELSEYLLDLIGQSSPSSRILVAISGIPGSGKSSIAAVLSSRVNAAHRERSARSSTTQEISTVVGLDGWHYSRAELDGFPDPEEAHWRRGAAFTFNGDSFVSFVEDLSKLPANQEPVGFPTFSHSTKDPVESSLCPTPIRPLPDHKLVIFEGLYTMLNVEPWCRLEKVWAERWRVEVKGGREAARERLVQRHVRTGVAPTLDAALHRADNSDLPNGDFLLANSMAPTRVIYSIEDADFAQEALVAAS